MAMVELYRTTRRAALSGAGQKFLDMRNLVADGGDDNQDRIPFCEQREAVGHAVRANYLYAGAADLYSGNGRRRSCGVARSDLEERRRKEDVHHGRLRCALRRRVARWLGRSVAHHARAPGLRPQLPASEHHGPQRNLRGDRQRAVELADVSGDGRGAVRRCVGTRALQRGAAGVSLDGTNYFYVNPLRQVEPLPTKLRWSRKRVPFVTSYCCPPNVLRTIAEVKGYAYSKSDDAIWVNLYGGNQVVDDARRTATEAHAADAIIRGTAGCESRSTNVQPTEFALKLRIPGWAESGHDSSEWFDRRSDAGQAGHVCRDSPPWKRATVVELQLPMPARLIEANPLVEETRNQVAIKRGPIVYCLESPDLPKDVACPGCRNPRDCETFKHGSIANLLDGVTVIEANVRR